jgi:O-antigen/teichoic acid export membrane protein
MRSTGGIRSTAASFRTTGRCGTAERSIAADTIAAMIESAPQTPPAPPQLDNTADDLRARRFSFEEPLRTRAARGTLINAGFTVGTGLLTLLKGFILAAFLTRADYGIWGVLVVSLGTLMLLKQVGIGDKFIQQHDDDQERAFQIALTLELIVTGACVLLIAIAVPVLVLIYDLPTLVLPSVVIAATLLISVFQAPLWVYYRRMEFVRQQSLAAVDPIVGFAVAVALAIAGAGYWAFVGGFAAGTLAASAVAVWRAPFKLRLRYERGTLRSYWSFSAPLLINGLAGFALAWAAVISAKLLIGIAAVGVIALSDNVAAFSERIDGFLTGALYPAICAVRDRTELLYESLVKSNRLALMWAVPFGIAVTLFASDLVRFVIGERWRSAIIVLQVFGATAAINHVGFNWTAYFMALGRTRPIAVATVLATVAFLLVGIPLLAVDGLTGFAIGIAAQAVVALVTRALYLQRLFPGFAFIKHAARSFVPTIPAALSVLAVRWLLSTPRTLALALSELALYIVVTVVATWYLESPLLREAIGALHKRGPGVVAA